MMLKFKIYLYLYFTNLTIINNGKMLKLIKKTLKYFLVKKSLIKR